MYQFSTGSHVHANNAPPAVPDQLAGQRSSLFVEHCLYLL